MINLYLCDDEDTARYLIQEEIEKKILIEEYDMKIQFSCGHPETFLDAIRSSPQKRNVYFLDVELKNNLYDGFRLGKEIRQIDPNGTLIYITSFQELAFQTFQYHLEAFDYIVKDAASLRDSLANCLASLNMRLQQESQKDITDMYSVKIGDMVKHVPLADILYFETSPRSHHIILHTHSSQIDFVGNLNEIEEQVGEPFIRTHRSYLVAANKITEIDLKHNKLKTGSMECLVSRKMKSVLLKKFKNC